MKYWIYDPAANKPVGPFSADEVKRHPLFNANASLCPVDLLGTGAWRPAHSIPELNPHAGGALRKGARRPFVKFAALVAALLLARHAYRARRAGKPAPTPAPAAPEALEEPSAVPGPREVPPTAPEPERAEPRQEPEGRPIGERQRGEYERVLSVIIANNKGFGKIRPADFTTEPLADGIRYTTNLHGSPLDIDINPIGGRRTYHVVIHTMFAQSESLVDLATGRMADVPSGGAPDAGRAR